MALRRVPKQAVWRRHRVWPWALAAAVLLLLLGLQLARSLALRPAAQKAAGGTFREGPADGGGLAEAQGQAGPSLPTVAVLDGRGAPVSGCVVELRVPGEKVESVAGTAAELCDAVELPEVQAGDYLLWAEAPGYRRAERPVHLGPGPSPLSLHLADGVALFGQVVDVAGRPLPGVAVVAFPTEASARTDGLGAFRLAVPSAGAYALEAHHSDFGGAVQSVTAPGAPVLLRLEPHAVLELQVKTGGQPLDGAQALLVRGHEAGAARQYGADRTTDADGGVRLLGIPAGSYTLEVSPPGGASPVRQEVVLREGAPTALTVAVPPVPPAEVAHPRVYRGRVVDEAQRPVPAFRIGDVEVVTDGGRFALPLQARGGTVAFRVEAPPLAQATVVRPADVEDVGDVVLHPAPLVRGQVQEADGGPAAGAFVICEGCRSEASGERHLAAFADADGGFTLAMTGPSGVLVGLLAMKDGRVGWGEAGRVGEAARLTLAAPSLVSGRVRRPEGAPVSAVAVVFSEPPLEPVLLVTGLDGRFAGEVPPGLYQLTLQPDGSRPHRTWTVQVPLQHPLELVTGGAAP